MKDKTAKKQIARIEPLIHTWAHGMGLGWYAGETQYFQEEEEFLKRDGTVIAGVAVMRVWADWRYMTYTIDVNLKAVKRLDDEALERAVVHELVHVLVHEMRENDPDVKHEERVVTQLTKAFFWVRDLKPNGDKKP